MTDTQLEILKATNEVRAEHIKIYCQMDNQLNLIVKACEEIKKLKERVKFLEDLRA